jgi:hypothetical protein
LEARAARRARELRGLSLPLAADALLELSVAALVLPRDVPPAVELDAPLAGAVAPGFAAPISPAAVPGPARPALSVAAGELVLCANAVVTASDRVVASNVKVSFLMVYSRY